MLPGFAFVAAALLLAAFAGVLAWDGIGAVDGPLAAAVLVVAAAAGAAVAMLVSRLLQRRGPIPGRLPLLGLLTVPVWGKLPDLVRVGLDGGYAGYFLGLVLLVARRARAARRR